VSETTPPTRTAETMDRVLAALRRVGRSLDDVARRASRRRVTLRGRDGTLWVRLPLVVAALIVLLVAVWWLPLVILAAIALFALGGQLSVDRIVGDDAAPR